MEEKMMLTMQETAKLTGIGLQKLKQIAREYTDFPYIKVGVKHLVIKNKLADWFEKHKGEEL
ncbi:DNA-binding protein [Fusobacterium animalis]|uniref:excisionase n=1 Tax=Fusobacterium animalis TaxID=76859 RepID=UPI0030D2C7D0